MNHTGLLILLITSILLQILGYSLGCGFVVIQCDINQYMNNTDIYLTVTSTLVRQGKKEFNHFAYINFPVTALSKVECFQGTNSTTCLDYGVPELSYVKDGVLYIAINESAACFQSGTSFSCIFENNPKMPAGPINTTTHGRRCYNSTKEKNANDPIEQTNCSCPCKCEESKTGMKDFMIAILVLQIFTLILMIVMIPFCIFIYCHLRKSTRGAEDSQNHNQPTEIELFRRTDPGGSS